MSNLNNEYNDDRGKLVMKEPFATLPAPYATPTSSAPTSIELTGLSQIEQMQNDDLADVVIQSVRKFREYLPYIIELKARFDTGDRDKFNRLKTPIKDCQSWKEFCDKQLDRTPQAIGQAISQSLRQSISQVVGQAKSAESRRINKHLVGAKPGDRLNINGSHGTGMGIIIEIDDRLVTVQRGKTERSIHKYSIFETSDVIRGRTSVDTPFYTPANNDTDQYLRDLADTFKSKSVESAQLPAEVLKIWVVMTHRLENTKTGLETSICNTPAFLNKSDAEQFAAQLNASYHFDVSVRQRSGQERADIGELWVSK